MKLKSNSFFTSLLILLFACFNTIVHSQETFLKIYPSPYGKEIHSIVETDDSQLIFCGRIYMNPDKSDRMGTMSKITSTGELVSTRNYDYLSGNSLFAEIINTPINGNYYLLGSQDSVSENQTISKVFVHTIDDELNIITRREFGSWVDYDNIAWDFEVLGDSIAYILSILKHHNTGKNNYLLIRADLLSNNYDYYLPNDSTFKAVTGLIIDEVNELIKVNYREFNYTMYPWNPVANISYDLSTIEVAMPENEFFSQTKISNKDDSTYLLSGSFYDSKGAQRDLGVAELVGSSICQPEATYTVLNKLTYDLELIEQFFYGGDGVYVPTDIIETNDHHIVVTGYYFDNEAVPFNCHFDPFVLKVNSEGLMVNTTNQDLPFAQEAIVFPNPGSSYLQVKLAIQHRQAGMELFDMNGRLVLTEDISADMQQVNTAILPAGIYPYRITANGKMIGKGKWVKE